MKWPILLLFLLATAPRLADAAARAPLPQKLEKEGPEFCRYAIYSASARPRGGPMPLFDFHQVTLPTDSLEYKYCERLFPSSSLEAFSPGFDIPADELHIPADKIASAPLEQTELTYRERIKSRTAPGIPDIRIASTPHSASVPIAEARKAAEWEPLMNFNLDAANIWQKILQCAPNAETARNNYFKGQAFCVDKNENDSLKNDLRAFRANLRNYLQTATIKDLRGAGLLPVIHPLFTQFLLEEISLLQINGGVDRGNRPYNETLALLVFTGKYPSESYIKSLDLDGPGRLQYSHLLRLVNAVFLLQMVPDTECRQWGLWPAITRNLVHSFDTMQSEHYGQKEIIISKINFACGDISRMEPSIYYYSPRGISYRDFIRTFRDMGTRY